ncbi:MAG TPA: WXG100 family type VII secretion target [Egibacteraceae bacterium]|jgi:uncharacterized protein YukE|nr:WXG100 family type VII secretion target [Egibacteraceae bacterium]
MAVTVKSTPQALQAIQQMQTTINSGIQDQLNQLRAQGDVLSDPNNWDGPLAKQFQASWPETHSRLVQMKEDLEQLRVQVQRINDNIMAAGGV